MSHTRLILTAGFAMFAMFFGSGNLVFPIVIGAETLDHFPYSTFGLLLTGVFVPFLGLLSLIYQRGDRHAFFAPLGKYTAFFLTLTILGLLGPFGVVPRCIIVAHGGIDLLFPSLSLPVFSAVFCILLALLAWRPTRIIQIIGARLTPLLMLSTAILIILGLTYSHPIAPYNTSKLQAFFNGLFQGYQIMDLLASFFFSSAIYAFIHRSLKEEKTSIIVPLAIKASLLGALLLALVYGGFVFLGAKFAPDLQGIAAEQLIVKIASILMGPYAIPVIATLIVLACLTTALILADLFSQFMYREIFKQKIPEQLCLIVTLSLSFGISLLGFGALAKWLAFLLNYAYPALIAYTVAMIIHSKTTKLKPAYFFWGVLILVIFLDFFKISPHI